MAKASPGADGAKARSVDVRMGKPEVATPLRLLTSSRLRVDEAGMSGVLQRCCLPGGGSLWSWAGQVRPGHIIRGEDAENHASLVLSIPVSDDLGVRSPGMSEVELVTRRAVCAHVTLERWGEYAPRASGRCRVVSMEVPLDVVAKLADDVPVSQGLQRQLNLRTAEAGLMVLPRDAPVRGLAELALSEDLLTPAGTWLASARAMETLIWALRWADDPDPGAAADLEAGERSRLWEAAERLEADLSNPPSLSQLAHAVGLSASRLSTSFKRLHGMSITAWVRQRRLERARTQIVSSSEAIKMIAWRAGYRHVANFTTAFRRAFGVTPAALRREQAP